MKVQVKKYLKLGTALRYLIDVREGEPLGGKHILDNFKTITAIITELKLSTTSDSAVYRQLLGIGSELNKASADGQVNISEEQADELNRLCRRVRDILLSEGDKLFVYTQERESEQAPEKITIPYLLKNLSAPVWLTFFGLLIGAYSAGVKTSHVQTVRELYELESNSSKTISNPPNTEPNESIQSTPKKGATDS